MSLLSICQEVASEIPVAAPAAIVGNPDRPKRTFEGFRRSVRYLIKSGHQMLGASLSAFDP